MVVHVCCKCLSPMFHLFFYMYVTSVLDACLKCFICFLLYLVGVISGFLKVDRDITHVAMVFQLYVPNVLSVLNVCCKYFI
jgi:hypothetical protein